jgi:hypothetical protein
MNSSRKIAFTARIEQHPGMDAAYIVFPFDVKEMFGVKGQVKVKAVFDQAVVYRGSLAKMGTPCHLLGITKDIRNQLEKTFGDEVHVVIEQDTDERVVELPEDVSTLLAAHRNARKFFESLSYTDRKEYIRWIEMAKQAETRQRRIAMFMEKLQAKKRFMEG